MPAMTRGRVIELWFAIVVMAGAAWLTFVDSVALDTAALLLALSLVPAGIVLLLWPQPEPPTAADVLRGQ